MKLNKKAVRRVINALRNRKTNGYTLKPRTGRLFYNAYSLEHGEKECCSIGAMAYIFKVKRAENNMDYNKIVCRLFEGGIKNLKDKSNVAVINSLSYGIYTRNDSCISSFDAVAEFLEIKLQIEKFLEVQK